MRERVRAELESLARLAALRPDLTVVQGEPGSGWSISMGRGVINVDPQDLLGRSPDFLAAITLHECAHSTLTRLWPIVPPDINDNPVEFILINTVEDGRIETWLAEWLPGCEGWLAETQAQLVAEHHRASPGAIGKNPAMDFCVAVLMKRHNLPLPAPIHPEAQRAMAETEGAVRRYFDCFPRFELLEESAGQCADRYAASPLPGCFAETDAGLVPTLREMAVRLSQYRAWKILHQEIRPVFLRLVAMNLDMQEALAFHEFLRRLSLAPSKGQRQERHAGFKREMLSRLRAAQKQRALRKKKGSTEPPGNKPAGGHYLEARAKHAGAINRLSDNLLDLHRTRGRMKWSRGHRHGQEPDLRAVLHFSATGRNGDRLWKRRHLPHCVAPAVILLADYSGSMRGEKARAAFASAVILREACHRAGIPLAVLAYNERAFVVQHFSGDTGQSGASRLEMLLHPRSGTDILEGLKAVDETLASSPCREHLVLVMADGMFDPCDLEAFRGAIGRWHRSSTRAHGLGIGPETEAMREWFPGDRVGLGPADLPREITRLLAGFIADLYRLPQAA